MKILITHPSDTTPPSRKTICVETLDELLAWTTAVGGKVILTTAPDGPPTLESYYGEWSE
jgi:hypothetical protein